MLHLRTSWIIRALLLSTTLTACAVDPIDDSVDQPASTSGTNALSGKADGDYYFEKCTFDTRDPFEPRTTFARGPWQGECHDTQARRPVDFVDYGYARQYQDPTGYLVINNVYHQGAFWIAFVPVHEVSQVYFQLEYFPAVIPAGHTQLRVEYREPVVLYGQSTPVAGQRDEVFDLTLSVEAVTRLGDQYDLFKGTQEHFAVAYRVTTMEARYEDMVLRQGHHVEQWVLLLEEGEKEALLSNYVTESAGHQLDHAYHTLFKNCTTEIIKVLDDVVAYSWQEQVQRFLVKVTEIYPNIVRAALIARGILPLDKSTDWFSLEEDGIFIERYEE